MIGQSTGGRVFEWGLVVLLSIGGVRSLVVWARRPFDSPAVADQFLYAVFRAARVASWFAFAGLFLFYATEDELGIVAQSQRLRWYFFLIVVLGAAQFLTSQLLARKRSLDPRD